VIYRILVDGIAWAMPEQRRRLSGASSSGALAEVMDQYGLWAPPLENHRVRFYFTERGWRDVGRHVVAEARRIGHVVRVLREKNPPPSRVCYRDELQVAILRGGLRTKLRQHRTHALDRRFDVLE